MVLTLLGLQISTCTRRALLTAAEKGIDLELKVVDILNGEQKNPEYISKHHPFGVIPVLYDGDFKVYESRAICRYIGNVSLYTIIDTLSADSQPGNDELYPRDIKKRALVEQWISIESSNYKPVENLVSELVFKPMKGQTTNPQAVEENIKALHKTLEVMDKELSQRSYVAGDQFTLADLFFIPFTVYLLNLEQFKNLFEQYPNVNRWWNSIKARPSYQKVIEGK
jgi:glutathione S-transferase